MKTMIACAVLAAAAASAAAAQPARPVLVGVPGPFHGCFFGDLTGLNPHGDNFLSVRSRPSVSALELDRLHPPRQVRLCQRVSGGRWYGIVYGPHDNAGCNLDNPPRRPRAYRGPCRSGWVSARYITISAG